MNWKSPVVEMPEGGKAIFCAMFDGRITYHAADSYELHPDYVQYWSYMPSHPGNKETAPSASSNIDYTAALREELQQFLEDESPVLFEDIDLNDLAKRLNDSIKASKNSIPSK